MTKQQIKRWTGEFPQELISRYRAIWLSQKPGENKLAPRIRSSVYPVDNQGQTCQTFIWKNE